MKHHTKRNKLAALLLAAVLLFTVLPVTAFAATNYGVTIAGVRVNSDNASNITGAKISGKVSYDPNTDTLTLENATIGSGRTVNVTSCVYLYNIDKLTIVLIGNNNMICEMDDMPSMIYTAVQDDDTALSFAGDGSLNITVDKAENGSYGMSARSLNFGSDCTVTISMAEEFAGWDRLLDCNSVSYAGLAATASVSPSGTPAVPFDFSNVRNYRYAKFQPAADVTLSFDGNGGVGAMADVQIPINGEYTLPTDGFTAPAGKQLKGWEVNGVEMAAGEKFFVSADTTIKAIWEDISHICAITAVDKVAPKCTEGGKEAHYKCEGCGKFFEDAQGVTVIADIAAWGNLDKLGHKDADANGKCDACQQEMVPNTGDSLGIWVWAALLLVSGGAIALILRKKASEN